MNKEHRHCSSCGELGHNRRSCTKTTSLKQEVKLPTKSVPETITYWNPDLFTGCGVKSLPSLVGWAPGTDSIAFHNQMKSLPFYSYDANLKAYRKV